MTTSPHPDHQARARNRLLQCILDHCRRDERVLAVLDYGSPSEGREDAWSDIDLALSIRPDAWEDFGANWETWLGECGTVLLGFISFTEQPWAVLSTDAAPVRVDLHLYGYHPHDVRSALATWPNAPRSVEDMLLFDREAALVPEVEQLVGQSLAPDDIASTFTGVAANFWYYVHRTWSKMQRGIGWDTRWNISTVLTGNLCALLRLEAGGVVSMGGVGRGVGHRACDRRISAASNWTGASPNGTRHRRFRHSGRLSRRASTYVRCWQRGTVCPGQDQLGRIMQEYAGHL